MISTPTRNSAKRDDKAPSTDANKKHNSVSSKSSKIGDVGGFGTESNIIIESVLHTPTRSNVRSEYFMNIGSIIGCESFS